MKDPYDFGHGMRGPIAPTPPGKTRITIRVDNDTLDWFRAEVNAAGGGNYQTLMNSALREYVQSRREPLEVILRRVVREELASYRTSE
jgi:BrnA antitoxin of type II toxin-antitoxin system